MLLREYLHSTLGIPNDDTGFDVLLASGVDSANIKLSQMTPYAAEWTLDTNMDTFDDPKFRIVPTIYMLEGRLVFDPPANPQLMSAIKDQLAELYFRVGVQ